MCRARDLMVADVITIREDAIVQEAIDTLLKHKISGLPVVDYTDRLVGIISEYQLLEIIFAPHLARSRVGELMTKDVVTVEEDLPVTEIASQFVLHRIRRVPVVRDGRIVGVIARRDLLRHTSKSGQSLSRVGTAGE